MSYKLIVTDMDGTLLGDNHEVTENNKIALKEALDSGIYVTVATGRMYSSAKSHIEFLNSKMPIIACNGALIKDSRNDEVIFSNMINKEICIKILDILEKYNVYYQYYSEELLMCKKRKNNKEDEMRLERLIKSGINLVSLKNLMDYIMSEEILKIIIVEENDISILDKITKELKLIEGIEITKSWFNNIEIMAKGSSKGNAVKFISEYLNIDKSDIIAFGDNYNDISMFQYVGTGVAMGNADEYVKSKADYVTSKNSEDGVANAIRELVCISNVNN